MGTRLCRAFAVLLIIFALALATEGCNSKSSRDKPIGFTGTGTGTGTSTGTGTGTGTGSGVGIELVCVYDPALGAQTSHKEHFGDIVTESSGYVWTGTKN
jgi:hypothetical protein